MSAASTQSSLPPDGVASSDDESDEEQQWSVRLRLLNAVDLPPSPSPSVPLCPWFQFGLVEDSKRKSQEEKRQSRTPEDSEDDPDDESSEDLTRLLLGLPPHKLRSSASKMVAKNPGAGNGVEWNEEYRWDGLLAPMESLLAVRLCARAPPERRPDGDPEDPPGDPSAHNNELAQLGAGIKELWRKGRQQLEEHRRMRGAPPHSREERAATVAHFLMQEEEGARGSTSPDPEEAGRRAEATEERRDDDRRAEGICLGTLAIPLSRLPLEDAFGGTGAAVVERWYQLDEPGGGGGGGDGASHTATGSTHGPRRCPSVLLEITFASKDYLDEFEDEAHPGEDRARQDKAWDLTELHADEEKENVFDGGEPDATAMEATEAAEAKSTGDEKKKKTNERPKPEEPELDPGVVDFVCVVGARDIGSQRNDDGSKGWVHSTPECCVLERFPPDDDFHIKNGR